MSSPITIEMKSEIDSLFKKLALPFSEYTFSNCYLFRKVHAYHLQNGFLKGKTRDGFDYLLPLSYPFDLEAGPHFFPIPEEWLSQFSQKKFSFETLPKDDDYLFLREKIQNYPGRKLAGQRNLLYQFEDAYDPDILPFTPEAALKVLEEWAKTRERESDYEECREAIETFTLLGLSGTLFASGNEPLGFLLGERLHDAYIVHFAKAKPGVKGIYPYMYRTLASRLPEEIRWLNFEQDLGIEGLVQAKSSYLPDTRLKKYRVSRIK